MNKFVTFMKTITNYVIASCKTVFNYIFKHKPENKDSSPIPESADNTSDSVNNDVMENVSENGLEKPEETKSEIIVDFNLTPDSTETFGVTTEEASTKDNSEETIETGSDDTHKRVVDETTSSDDEELLSRIEEDHSDVSYRLLNEFRDNAHCYQPKPILENDIFRIIFYKLEDIKDKFVKVKVDRDGNEYIIPANDGIFFPPILRTTRYKFKGTWNEIERVTKLLKLKFYYVIVNSKGEYVYADTTDNPVMW